MNATVYRYCRVKPLPDEPDLSNRAGSFERSGTQHFVITQGFARTVHCDGNDQKVGITNNPPRRLACRHQQAI